ncbi:yciC, partial [Symbiodinium microadriaticum]
MQWHRKHVATISRNRMIVCCSIPWESGASCTILAVIAVRLHFPRCWRRHLPASPCIDLALEITLWAWLHPSMKAPDGFVFDSKAHPFKITPSMNVVDLMDEMEQVYEEASNEKLELQINVLWNTKDPKKALNPTEKVQMHFADGETFGVYGEIAPAQTARMDKPEEEKIPVTILTGFLGAGKTTMLNYILEEQREKKIAIIENEFGEVPIDDALLKQGQEKLALAEKIVVMDNGCMCCTIRGDLLSG